VEASAGAIVVGSTCRIGNKSGQSVFEKQSKHECDEVDEALATKPTRLNLNLLIVQCYFWASRQSSDASGAVLVVKAPVPKETEGSKLS
jgi:hypothetical protein